MHICPIGDGGNGDNGGNGGPTGGGSGGGNSGASPVAAPARPSKSAMAIGKDVAVYAGMYGVSLGKELVSGIAGWFTAGRKLMVKSKARKAAKREQERQQARAQTVAAVAREAAKAEMPAEAPRLKVDEPIPKAKATSKKAAKPKMKSASTGLSPATSKAVDEMVKPEQPDVEAGLALGQQGEADDSATANDAVSSSIEAKERKKTPGRRGIKLKTDI